MNRIGLVLCMLAVGVVALPGLFFVLKGARRIQQSIASTKWPTVMGKGGERGDLARRVHRYPARRLGHL